MKKNRKTTHKQHRQNTEKSLFSRGKFTFCANPTLLTERENRTRISFYLAIFVLFISVHDKTSAIVAQTFMSVSLHATFTGKKPQATEACFYQACKDFVVYKGCSYFFHHFIHLRFL
jgi:hypothetical protein